MIRLPPIPTLFPYTTLFRSGAAPPRGAEPRGEQGGLGHATPDRTRSGDRRLQGIRDLRRPSRRGLGDRKSTRLNSSHANISYAVFCLKKKKPQAAPAPPQPP